MFEFYCRVSTVLIFGLVTVGFGWIPYCSALEPLGQCTFLTLRKLQGLCQHIAAYIGLINILLWRVFNVPAAPGSTLDASWVSH